MNYQYSETNRSGDHIWYISNLNKFKEQYPGWDWTYDLKVTMSQIHDSMVARLTVAK